MAVTKFYQPYSRVDHYELDGTIKLLGDKVSTMGEAGEVDALYYEGAQDALEIIRGYEFVDKPQDFVRLLGILLDRRKGDPWA